MQEKFAGSFDFFKSEGETRENLLQSGFYERTENNQSLWYYKVPKTFDFDLEPRKYTRPIDKRTWSHFKE